MIFCKQYQTCDVIYLSCEFQLSQTDNSIIQDSCSQILAILISMPLFFLMKKIESTLSYQSGNMFMSFTELKIE
jgi:hypothetical protein